MNKIIIFDNHLHLREYGKFIDAVKEFKKAGGTHFILCQLPMVDLVIKNKSYRDAYEITLKMVEKIKSNIEIGVFVTLGPYPVDYIKLNQHFGRKKAIEIMKNGIDIAKDFCDEKKSVAIGEIGRPHFNVDRQTMEDSNYVLSYAMKRAAEGNIPIVIHSESTTSKNCKEFVEMGKKEGLKPEKIIKHFSPPLIYKEENFGLFPSVLASTKNLKIAFKKGTRFLMETDYIDDPLRPGAVLGPKSVPKKTLYMYDNKEITEDQIYKVHKENPERIYNINLD